MNGKQKTEAAFSGDGSPEIAATICYEGIMVRDHWEELTSRPWWYQHAPDVERQMAWRQDMAPKVGQDWIQLASTYFREQREVLDIRVRGEDAFWFNRRSGKEQKLERAQVAGWRSTRELHSFVPKRPIETREEIDGQIPVPAEFDRERFIADGRADLASQMRKEFPHVYPIGMVGSPLWHCYTVWGFEGMMTMVAERPDLVEHACRRTLPSMLNGVRQAAALGAEGIWIEECFTDMIGPEAFKRLNLPFVRAIIEEIRGLGMKSIYYFCGNPAGKWDLLLDAGADAISLEETKKNFVIDIEDVVDHVQGRCTVLGNLDAIGVLQNGTEARLRAEIRRQIAAGRRNGSRFIMGLGSPVTPLTPIERVRLYCDLTHELGRR